MADINSIKNEVKSMIGLKFGNYNASLKELRKTQEHKDFGNGKLIVFGSTNPFEHVTKACNNNGAYSIEDANTNRTYAGCGDINKNFTSIMMNRGRYYIDIKDNLSDKKNKGVIDENDTIIIYGDGVEPKETTLKEFLG